MKLYPEPPEEVILAGGEDVTVTLRGGTRLTLQVRILPMRQLAALGAVWTQEAEELELYTGRPAEWLDTLLPESWSALVEKGRGLNFFQFAPFWSRQQKVVEAIRHLKGADLESS